jgi:hypothetical protein
VGPTKRGKGAKLMAVADRFGLPLAACAVSAAPSEVTLVAPTLDSRFVDELPRRLIGDRGYDADLLDVALVQMGIEMIAPHRRNRTRPKTQDGRRGIVLTHTSSDQVNDVSCGPLRLPRMFRRALAAIPHVVPQSLPLQVAHCA